MYCTATPVVRSCTFTVFTETVQSLFSCFFSRGTIASLFTSLVEANQAELLQQFQDIVTTLIQTNRLQTQENERLEASFHRYDLDLENKNNHTKVMFLFQREKQSRKEIAAFGRRNGGTGSQSRTAGVKAGRLGITTELECRSCCVSVFFAAFSAARQVRAGNSNFEEEVRNGSCAAEGQFEQAAGGEKLRNRV